MALTGKQYQSMRLKFRGLIASPFAGVSEAELDSFIGQLAIDATGSVTAAQKTQADGDLAIRLISPDYTPVAADIATFLAQALAACPLVLQALVPARYQQLKNQLTGALSVSGIRTEAQMLAYLSSYFATGDFSAIFTAAGFTVTHYLRADLGVNKTGSIVNSWTAQIGPTITEGAGGVGIGTVTAGINGRPGIASDGSTQWGTYTLAMAAPGTTPTHQWHICRLLAMPPGFGYFDGQAANCYTTYVNTSTTDLRWQNPSLIAPVTLALNSWGCMELSADNSVNCYMKFGAAAALVGNPGNNASAGLRGLFAQEGGAGKGQYEILAKVCCTGGTPASFATAAVAAKTLGQSFYSAAVN